MFISPDVATCSDCLRELFDPADRRYRYPFLNCTNCGPRLTIITSAPYDRERTTMAGFAMCAACRTEYEDPRNRRFHAQPTACPACGPQLQLLDATGQSLVGPNPLADFAEALLAGKIGALKGLGGYHLACDARNLAAVTELRRRKHRDEKPFAVMIPSIEAAEAVCAVGAVERELLRSPRAPIVLLRKRAVTDIAANVAPGNPWLGLMLPYATAPFARSRGGRNPARDDQREPLRRTDRLPRRRAEKLTGIADVFLTHNRPIHVRCDDSVTRVVDGTELPVRRSRGYAPRPGPAAVRVPSPDPGRRRAAQGDVCPRPREPGVPQPPPRRPRPLRGVPRVRVRRAPVRTVVRGACAPEWLVHDLHPDYASTRYAMERAARSGEKVFAVQHHHAHMASCMVENGLMEPVIGVTFDGTGYGTDGTVWGGGISGRRLQRVFAARRAPSPRRHAGRRTSNPRAVADGGGPSHGRRSRIRTGRRAVRFARLGNGTHDAGTAAECTAHVQRGKALRRARGARRNPHPCELRRASRDRTRKRSRRKFRPT